MNNSTFLRTIILLLMCIHVMPSWAENESNADLIEEGWACFPQIHKSYSFQIGWNGRRGQPMTETVDEGLNRFKGEVIEFPACKIFSDYEKIRDAFINEYIENFLVSCNETEANLTYTDLRKAAMECSERFKIKSSALKNSLWVEYQSDRAEKSRERKKAIEKQKWEAEFEKKANENKTKLAAEEAHKAKVLASEQTALRIRKSQLANGSLPVANFEDAYLLHKPKLLFPMMQAPLLKPDNLKYTGKVIIVSENRDKSLRVKAGGKIINFFGDHYIPISYALLRITNNTIDFSMGGLRLNEEIRVIGKYVQNEKTPFETIPIIEVMFIGY